jgi:WXG100 family type VII secretion target
MSADVIQARYDDLAAIAARFGEQAEQSAALQRRVSQCADTLVQEGWEGAGVLAFRAEMDDEVFPALQRLIQALEEGRAVTLQASTIMQQAEEEAAALFQGEGAGDGTGQQGAVTGQVHWPSAAFSGMAAKLGWQLFKDRNAWRALFQGVRFVKDEKGMWRLVGSAAAKRALGVSPNLTRFGQAAIAKNLKHFSVIENLKHVKIGKGPFAPQAAKLWQSISTTAPLTPAAGFLKQFKGAAGLGSALTLASNIYEFGWGESKDTGLLSRQFLTATTADVSAGIGIVAASTAIGTLIPVPGLGTAAGLVVGLGLQYAYDTWGKEAWRGMVDQAGQYIQENAGQWVENIGDMGRSISNAAHDTFDAIGQQVSEVGNQFQEAANATGKVFNDALSGAGKFFTGLV